LYPIVLVYSYGYAQILAKKDPAMDETVCRSSSMPKPLTDLTKGGGETGGEKKRKGDISGSTFHSSSQKVSRKIHVRKGGLRGKKGRARVMGGSGRKRGGKRETWLARVEERGKGKQKGGGDAVTYNDKAG